MPGAAFSWHYAEVERDNCCYQAFTLSDPAKSGVSEFRWGCLTLK
jgi:hypothetical protein